MDKIVPLTRNNDFRRAYARGKSYVSPVVVVYVIKNRYKMLRVGITTSKKIGNAVHRSRARRVIREAYRQLAGRVRPGVDLVFVARGRTPYVKSTEVQRHMEKQLKAAGVLLEEGPAEKPAQQTG
ncbi:ribonuclease P protein component [Acutalibacter caecimuris]|uniref:ribonuclease P protein component n=1 Tax=Acutalibacter caecimuris TaxID=3093657 RepID=UPI002AC8C458|nr:ribonuclease P protein component [Acutalibacter sp. M00118]